MVGRTAAAWVTGAVVLGSLAPASPSHALRAAAPGVPTAVAIEAPTPPVCIGGAARVTWAPPIDDGGGLTGYRIIDTIQTAVGVSVRTREVKPDVTSLALDTTFGLHAVQVLAVNAAGATPAAAPVLEVNKPPTAPTYRDSTVGDGRISITFGWPGPVTTVTTGGSSMTPVMRVRLLPAGRTVEAAPGTPVTFEGLPNGEAHSFDAVVVNACGESPSAGGSPELTPAPPPVAAAAAPVIVDARPALRARAGRPYTAAFAASGAPAPSFALRDAPAWLTIEAASGRVRGVPPRRTDAFTFTVVVANGVGVDAVAGPFEVVLRTPVRALARR